MGTGPHPQSSKFLQRVYLHGVWRQQWTATAAEQRPDSTAALSSCSSVVSKRLPTADHPRNAARITTSESERVFSDADVDPFRSFMTEDRLG